MATSPKLLDDGESVVRSGRTHAKALPLPVLALAWHRTETHHGHDGS